MHEEKQDSVVYRHDSEELTFQEGHLQICDMMLKS